MGCMRILPLSLLGLTVIGARCLAQSGPVAHFACDEGSGDVIKDSVGGLTGTIQGATWVKSGARSHITLHSLAAEAHTQSHWHSGALRRKASRPQSLPG